MTKQIAALDDLIARGGSARNFLEHGLACPADHPVDECEHMIDVLDKRLGGVTIEQLATEHGREVPSAF
ncbi:hypothetical protein [Mycobacterium sp. ACS1612]|uniref:hypothetical protein n=1 Tax=Mycobacterium sp. ACS1612 TaxID=1834117 RepID=UPI001E2F89E6|nr:hypothetical protein [Mycobacterium sp. ACS1612]